MTDWNALAKEIHENAVAKGWWETERSWEECRILVVSELAEALEEYRAGRMTVWFSGWHGSGIAPILPETKNKPEGFPIELADAAIRILDWFGRDNGSSEYINSLVGRLPVDSDPMPLGSVPLCLDWAVQQIYSGEFALVVIVALAAGLDIDLEAMIRLKHEYNKTRPYRHGGKAA